jgi:hypothetical protein
MQHIEPKFPQDLLNATSEEKLAYFEHKKLGHPHLTQAYKLALDCVEFSGKGEIVPIIGPTGVGTTELGRKLYRNFNDVAPTFEEDGRVLPLVGAIGFEAPNAGDRIDKDYWKRVMTEMLHRGGDVLIDRKTYVPPSQFMLTHPIPHGDPMQKGIDTLVHATVNMLEHRRTKVVLINHADRLFPDSDPAGCNRSQQILMDLAAQTHARFVLIGGYQLVRSSCARNNWLRRQHTVHFRRYDRNDPAEYAHFRAVLIDLLAHMPTAQRLDKIRDEWVMRIYVSTVGCIGSMKRVLLLALQHALRTGEKMTEDFILQFALHNVVALEIAKEARMGEHLLLDVTAAEVEQVLNGPLDAENGGALAVAKPRPKTPTGGKAGFGRRRIGERKSSRDPVGDRNGK